MTDMLKKAIAAASRLPPADQDAIGALWLADIEAELRWDQTLEDSAESLSALGDDALAEDRAGKTKPLDPETL